MSSLSFLCFDDQLFLHGEFELFRLPPLFVTSTLLFLLRSPLSSLRHIVTHDPFLIFITHGICFRNFPHVSELNQSSALPNRRMQPDFSSSFFALCSCPALLLRFTYYSTKSSMTLKLHSCQQCRTSTFTNRTRQHRSKHPRRCRDVGSIKCCPRIPLGRLEVMATAWSKCQ